MAGETLAAIATIGAAFITLIGAGIGYGIRKIRDEVRKNSAFRQHMTGEDVEGADGELPEIDETFADITEELEAQRHQREREHEKVWRGLAAMHQTLRRLVNEINRYDEIEAEVEEPDHPFEYRGGDPRADGGDPGDD